MIKRFIIAFVLLVLIGGGIVGFNLFRDQAIKQFFASMPVPTVTVSTVTVEPVTWTPGIEAIGTAAAARGVDLTVETSGVVKEILFTANEQVAEGSILLHLDDAVQRADLAAAEAQSDLDEQSLDRAMELQKRGVSSVVTLDAARAASVSSASQVEKLKAVLDQKQLKAPFSGTIGIPKIEAGQYIVPGDIVATLQDLMTMRVDFSVPEQLLDQLRIGQPVAFGVTAADMPFTGTVAGIEPKVDPVTRLVSVRAVVTNPDGKLSPGQFLQVRVQLPAEAGVLAVPQTALVSSLYGDFIFVARPVAAETPATPADASGAAAPSATPPAAPALTARQVFVKVGRRSDGRVEILDGIAAGDQVVTAGQNRLSNGAPLAIDNTINPGDTLAAGQ